MGEIRSKGLLGLSAPVTTMPTGVVLLLGVSLWIFSHSWRYASENLVRLSQTDNDGVCALLSPWGHRLQDLLVISYSVSPRCSLFAP
jgi:hypothetical protein